jgi:hypothetical protein
VSGHPHKVQMQLVHFLSFFFGGSEYLSRRNSPIPYITLRDRIFASAWAAKYGPPSEAESGLESHQGVA